MSYSWVLFLFFSSNILNVITHNKHESCFKPHDAVCKMLSEVVVVIIKKTDGEKKNMTTAGGEAREEHYSAESSVQTM